jgi:hypothetical protein
MSKTNMKKTFQDVLSFFTHYSPFFTEHGLRIRMVHQQDTDEDANALCMAASCLLSLPLGLRELSLEYWDDPALHCGVLTSPAVLSTRCRLKIKINCFSCTSNHFSMVEHAVAAYLDWLHDARATSPRTLWLLFSAGAYSESFTNHVLCAVKQVHHFYLVEKVRENIQFKNLRKIIDF